MAEQRLCLEDRLILQLCRNAPDYDSVLQGIRQESVNWRRLVRTAQAHRLASLTLDRLLGLPLPPDARAALQGVGKREIVSVIHDNAVFKYVLACLLQKLRDAGIETILLKGLSLNFSGLRWMGDIDLMVPETRVTDAIDTLLSIDGCSYQRMGKDGPDAAVSCRQRLPATERHRVQAQLAWNNEFHLISSASGVLIELHHRLFQIRNPDGRFIENIEGVLRGTPLFWQYRRYDPALGCFTLSASHSLFLACLRNAIKQQPANDSFRLSNLVDIDNLVAAGIPWPLFLRDCLALETAPFILFSLTLVRKLLGTPIPPTVLQELTGACTSGQLHALSIHRRCVASLDLSSALYSKLYKAMSPFVFGGTFREKLQGFTFMPVWLPSRSQMALFYGLRKGSPVIALAYLANPVRWVHRILTRGRRVTAV
jgi:hypothetical protein